ncbi:MAG: TolC family protein [bacterium]
MKKWITIILLLPWFISQAQQQGITLQACLDSAVQQYPSIRQLEINQWYKINLDIEQMIYDGGLSASQKKLEIAKRDVSDQKVQVELYQLKERIYAWFFNIIYLNKNIEILEVLYKNLEARIEEMEIALEEGMILSSDVDALKVEMHNINQQIIALREDMHALLEALSIQTGFENLSADLLIQPDITIDDYTFENNRPEYIMFSKQQAQLSEMGSVTQVKRRPVFSAFGQAGYGRPGYDMLNENFDDYYMIGVRMRWHIWDWGKVKREKQVYNLQNGIIRAQKETFDQNLRSDLAKRFAEIDKYEKIITTDEEIVHLQENVMNTVDAQFRNGTVTSTNYLIEVNKLVKARLNLEAHKLQLVYARYQYITTKGNL